MKLATQQIIARGNLHLFWMLALAAFISPLASALEVRGEKVTQADISKLPPVCRLILVERPGVHNIIFKGMAKPGDAELFDRPEYAMGKNNEHLHHYCWALVSKMRYFRAQDANGKKFQLSQFIGDMDYVLQKSPKDWPYFHRLLVDQAEMMKVHGDYPYSILKIDEALRHKPDYERAYALKSEVYLAMGDKKKAIDAAQEGFDKIPQSKLLRWRLEKLGVKVPPPLPDAENASGEATADSSTPAQQTGSDASDANSIVTPPAAITPNAKDTGQGVESKSNTPPVADSVEKNQDKPATETGSQPKNNPYCRFCP